MTLSTSTTAYLDDQAPELDLRHDFELACAELAQAKLAVRTKDTPAARARLGRCAARVDEILDRSNDTARRTQG
jgi:hypothetical protein